MSHRRVPVSTTHNCVTVTVQVPVSNRKCVNATAFARLRLTVGSHARIYQTTTSSPLSSRLSFPTAYPFKYLKNRFESQNPITNRRNADVKYLYSL